MIINVLKSKIHRAKVTEADLNYVGSITIDKNLMEKSAIYEYEKVQVVDINNGNRLETYVIEGEPGSGTICLNGAAARLIHPNDLVIIMAYTQIDDTKVREHKPKIVLVNEENEITEVINKE